MPLINNVESSKIKLSPREKLSYATGDFANNFSWALVSSYLMFFWTDVTMIPAALCGTFMLISKLWDAVLDPIVGVLADHTKSKWGHYRPWILFGCVPMLVVNVLCFTVLPTQSAVVKACYSLACYFLLVTIYACVNNPYSAMPAALTLDGDTRSSLASYRMTAAFIATLILSQFMLPFVDWMGQGNQVNGFFFAALTFSVIAFPFYLFCFFNTKEVVNVPSEDFDFRKLMKVLSGNRPVWIMLITFVFWGFYEASVGVVKLYYFTYFVGNQSLFIFNAGLLYLGRVFGAFSLSKLVTKVNNKRTLPMVSFLIGGVLMIIMNFLPVHTQVGLIIYNIMTFITGIGGGLGLASMFGMVPDTTEYSQNKYHVRAAGFISSFINFAFKVGMALCTAVIGWVLGFLGYSANLTQTPTVLSAINICMNLVCGITLIAGGILMAFYDLDKNKFSRMVDELGSSDVDSVGSAK